MKFIFSTFFLLFFSIFAEAQDTGIIKGPVLNEQTAEIVDKVSISVLNQADKKPVASTTSDAQGNYSLVVPPGMYQITAKKSGFWYREVDNIPVIAGKVTELKIGIKKISILLQEK